MDALDPSTAHRLHPMTFLERGVAVPFTTPMLGGTRIRPAENGGLQLVVPNPSAARDLDVMGSQGITALFRPTLHDKALCQRICAVQSITPTTIRRAARQVAAEGLAGEAAMEAARRAIRKEHADQLAVTYKLLAALTQQVGLKPPAGVDPSTVTEARARIAIAHVAPRIGQTASWVTETLEAIAACLVQVGISADGTDARIPRLIALLRVTRGQVRAWSQQEAVEDPTSNSGMICAAVDVTLSLAASTLACAHALTDDMVGLLRRWATDPEAIMPTAVRPEWVLDGWDKICLVWRHARDDTSRHVALAEMAQLLPVMPDEAREWCESGQDVAVADRPRRLVRMNEVWRTGAAVHDLIARNEHIRAMTC